MKSYPNLRTILLVEKFLSDKREDLFSKAAIIRALGGRINNQTLSIALDYLEASNKVMQGSKGVQWIASEGFKAKELLKDALFV